MTALDDIKKLSASQLSVTADCGTPDSDSSAGAAFLTSIRDAVVEAWESDLSVSERERHEIADGAPDVYTHTRWLEFVDLCAYQETPDLGEWPDDLTQLAGVALYQIADRLVNRLVDELESDSATDTDADSE